jgi:hypothetical protein
LLFTRGKIDVHYNKLAESVPIEFRKTIIDVRDNEETSINEALKFLKANENSSIVEISRNYYSSLMDTISSSLSFYRKNLDQLHKDTGVKGYSLSIEKVNNILALGGPSEGNKTLFDKYYETEAKDGANQTQGKASIFISYQDKDRDTACNIKHLLVNNSELKDDDVFVAHRDIKLSKIWRDDIVNHLDTCTHLIALCTENFKCSAWGNQEVGYAMARKKVEIIPLFWEDTDRDHFGFLEGFQGLPEYINKENLESAIKELLKRIGLSAF